MVHLVYVVGSTFGLLSLQLLKLIVSMLAPAHQVELEFTMLSLHLSLEMTSYFRICEWEHPGTWQGRPCLLRHAQ